MRHRHEYEREQEKIERVQRPAKKTGDKGIALVAVEQFKQPDRFHGFIQLVRVTTNQHE